MSDDVPTTTPDALDALPRTVAAIAAGMDEGIHIGAQLRVVPPDGAPIDLAIGRADLDVDMRVDTMMPWLSASKGVFAVAFAQVWAAGKVDLDDPVAMYVPEFAANGKDRITIRHLLTHTGGIRTAEGARIAYDGRDPADVFDETIAFICAATPEPDWVPGRKAGYQLGAGTYMLAEVIRRVDGRRYDRYVREEVFGPLGLDDCLVGLPPERRAELGDRLGVLYLTSTPEPMRFPLLNGPDFDPHVVPSGGGRGPISGLARVYEVLRDKGTLDGITLLPHTAVEAMVARHRAGMYDHTYNIEVDWGLHLMVDAISFGRHCSPRTFGHGGMQSSTAFCDPDAGLVVAYVCNGLPGDEKHYPRLERISSAVYEDLGLVEAGDPGRDHPRPIVSMG